jgi:hypothetical protein
MCPEDDRGRVADKKKFRVELVSLALTMREKNARGSRLRKIREDTDPLLPWRVVRVLRFVETAVVKTRLGGSWFGRDQDE